MNGKRYAVSVDVGGTFTDLALFDIRAGEAAGFHKVLTDHGDPSKPVLDGIGELLDLGGVSPASLAHIVHSTTLVTNAIIARQGAPTALITTRGFRDVLEIGAEQMYDIYDLFAPYPQPLIPRELRFEVDERLDADGRVVRPLQREEAAHVLDAVAAAGAEAVAISLLHAFRNPAHERSLREIAAERHPDLAVSISSVVAPTIGEYERSVTVAVDAYTKPLLRRYVQDLLARLEARMGMAVPVYMVLSTGGIATAETAMELPVRLLESGPAAGAFGASHFAGLAGHADALSFDLGGTTAKACVVEDGAPGIATMLEADRVHRFKPGSGLPVITPSVELIEIGAGGGSIAHVDELGLLRVGPQSAESDPGPAGYGRGGTLPTVTDANLVLGYLDEGSFLGGRMRLRRDLAEEAIVQHVGEPLGLTLVDAARGIHAIVNENMARAARTHVLERNRDPRDLAIVAFGGGGPTHACGLARLLGARRVIVPFGAGVGSAVGALTAPFALAFGRSFVTPLAGCDWEAVLALYADLREEARRALEQVAGDEPIALSLAADMRYSGQHHDLRVALPDHLGEAAEHEIGVRFREHYAAVYGRAPANLEPEIVTWHLTASTAAARPLELASRRSGGPPSPVAPTGERPVFAGAEGFVDTPVFARASLGPGSQVRGPAIVEEAETTIVLPAGATGSVDPYLSFVIDLEED